MTDAAWNIQEPSADDWQLVRQVRLEALAESPQAFLAHHHHEASWGEREWRRTFEAARWFIADAEGAIGLLRSVRDPTETQWREVESIWVAPTYRKRGVARSMLCALTESERAAGASDLWLWVLEENYDAQQVYERLGFAPTGHSQPLPGYVSRFERRLCLRLPARSTLGMNRPGGHA